MDTFEWVKKFPGAITVCDSSGMILFMNEKAAETFRSDGGERLVGQNVLDCHPEPARSRLQGMLATGQANMYMIEKRGKRKMIYQTPWYDANGQYAGFVELSLEIPREMPLFQRGE